MADEENVSHYRLFFALWPDENLRQQIINRRQAIKFSGTGQPVKTENLHITLAYLGNITTEQESCAVAMADNVKGAPFTVGIDTADYWTKPRIIWIGPSVMPDSMVSLAKILRDGALDCGIQMDSRSYNAHITLMRKVTRQTIKKEMQPFNWQATSFVLVKSTSTDNGLIYDVINEWPLIA